MKWIGRDDLSLADITSVTAGVGLSGGGTSGAVTLTLDLSELSDVTPVNGDYLATLDSDGSTEQKTTVAALATLFAGTGLTASSAVIGVDASQTQITSIGTIGTGTWQGTKVASAYLDDDTAHLSGAQTFQGAKRFNEISYAIFDGDKNVTPGDGAIIHVDSHIVTDNNTSGSGTAAKFTHVNIEAPRLAATNSSVTTTNAASLYIDNAPTAGTNQTITNPYALWVDAGLVKFDGALTVDGTITGDVTGNCSGTAATVTAAAQPAIESIGTDGDTLSILGDILLIENTTSSAPQIKLTNETDNPGGPIIQLESKRVDSSVQAGEDNDLLGTINFNGRDDQGTPAFQYYASIFADIHDATSGEESGRLTFQVANHDGGLGSGLSLTGGSEDNEIDVTVGLGANSVITIPGDIDLAGDIDVDGTLETDALTVGGTPFTPSTTKQMTHHEFTDDMGTTKQYIGLLEADAENTNTANKFLPFPAIVAGKLIKVALRSNKNLTGHTLTWRLESIGAANPNSATPDILGTQSGAGCNNTTMTIYDFTSSLDSGANAFDASDLVYLSIQSDTDFGSNVIYYITCLWEWDLS